MGPTGAIIMGFFGAMFFALGVTPRTGWLNPVLLLPALVFAALALAAVRRLRGAPANAYRLGARGEQVLRRATLFEAIGVPIVVMALANTGHADLVVPGIAAVVGLHFLPMAYSIPFWPLYPLAAAVLAAAVAGFILPQPVGSTVTGLIGAAALWVASVMAVRRPPEAIPR